ncbi:precorrin-6y C5,15-methyltransferase (decarboxylating) subunit CbiE [Roseivivax sp. CAU 1761]
MSEAPWLTIVGLGEDGPEGLAAASHEALRQAEIVMGPPRHLELLAPLGLAARRVPWPVPFAEGLARLDALRGRRVAVLASGDPFWFGAGAVLADRYGRGEWRALPAPSTFGLAAAEMGWRLEQVHCAGLHAAPLARLRPVLAPGRRALVLLRDGDAVAELCAWLTAEGFGASRVTALQALGGPRQARRDGRAEAFDARGLAHPLCAALEVAGSGAVLGCAAGRDDALFDSDGQITKRPVRALTLSALAPRPGERLWDIGGGSGSVAIEWLLADPSLASTSIERRPDRAARIRANAARLGCDRLDVVEGAAPEALDALPAPQAVFVGGGLSGPLLDRLAALAPGTRIVANAVTLESEALLTAAQARLGGALLRLQLSEARPLGRLRGWQSAYPVTQWSVTL